MALERAVELSGALSMEKLELGRQVEAISDALDTEYARHAPRGSPGCAGRLLGATYQQVVEVFAEQLLPRVAQHLCKGVVDKHDGALLHARVADHKGVVQPLHGAGQVDGHARQP
eukprot:scaffold116050_cov29-Prasinocladus_malaysianus.AAC.1